MTDDQRAVYSATITVRNIDVNLRWSISQIFFLIHSAGFTLVITRLTPGSSTHSLACFGGFVLSIIWWLIARRMQDLINFWNRKLGDMEGADDVQIVVFSDRFIRGRPRVTTHGALLWMVAIFGLVWAGAGLRPLIGF